MTVRDLMTTEVRTCSPDGDLATVAMILWRHDCGAVPVVADHDGRVMGMITDRDIAMAVALRRCAPDRIRVREVMGQDVVTIRADADVSDALEALARAQVRRLPVVDEAGRAVGILSLNDLVLRTPEGRSRGRDMLAKDDVLEVLRAVSAHRPLDGARARPDGAAAAGRGLAEVPGLKAKISRKLEAEGIRSLSELAVLEFTADRRRHIAERTGLTPAAALRFAGLAGILRLDGMTERHARALFEAGIDSYEKLRTERKDRLQKLLAEVDPDPAGTLERWIAAGPLAVAAAR